MSHPVWVLKSALGSSGWCSSLVPDLFIFLKITFIYVCMWACCSTCRDQRTTCWSECFPFTMWGPRVELQLPGLKLGGSASSCWTILLITYSQLLFAGLSLVCVRTDSVVRLLWFLMLNIRVLLAITENPTTEFPNMWKCIYFSHVGIHVFICEHVYLYICVLRVELWRWVWESPLIAPCLTHVGKLWNHAQSSPPIRLAWLTSLLQGNLSHLLGTGLQRWNCVSSLCDRNINC